MARGRTLSIKVETEVRELEKIAKAGQNLARTGRALTVGLTLPLVAAGTAAVKFASDVEEASSKASTVFTNESDRILSAAKNLDDAFSEATFLDTAGTFGALLQSMGLTEKAAADLSLAWLDLSQDMASFHNTKPEDALAAIQSALAGEFEPLKRYGVMLNDTVVKQKALEQGLYDGVGAIDAQTRALVINQELLRQQPKVLGDYERTADGVANSTRRLLANFEDAAASLGKELLPFATEFVGVLNEWVTGFAALDAETKGIIVRVAAFAAILGPLLIVVGRLVDAFATMAKLFPALRGSFRGLFGPLGLAVGALAAITAEFEDLDKRIDPVGHSFLEVASSVGKSRQEIEGEVERLAQSTGRSVEDIQRQLTGFLERGVNWDRAVDHIERGVEGMTKPIHDAAITWAEEMAAIQDSAIDGAKGAADGMAGEMAQAPEKMADALLANQFQLGTAIDELLAYVEASMAPGQQLMDAQGFLMSQELADALVSNNPYVRIKAQEMQQAAIDAINANLFLAMDSGMAFASTYAAGIVNNLGVVADAGRQLGGALARNVRIESEPPDPSSPLAGITNWGRNIVRTIADGITRELGVASSASAALAGALVTPGVAGPRAPRSAAIVAGMGAGNVTNINLTFTGDPPDARDEKEIVTALQRLAPFIDGKMAPGY